MEAVTTLVAEALAEVNELLPPGQSVSEAAHTVLIGEGGALDSVGLVNLIVAIEARVEQQYGRSLGLAELLANDQQRERLRTVGGLTAHIQELVSSGHG